MWSTHRCVLYVGRVYGFPGAVQVTSHNHLPGEGRGVEGWREGGRREGVEGIEHSMVCGDL